MNADVTIIGLGPAGLQAAIHAARRKVKVVAVGKSEASALNRAELENYFGVSSSSGEDLLKIGREQATKYGAELLEEDVVKMNKEGEEFIIITDTDREIRSKAIVLAVGISRAKLNVPGEKEFLGKGVSYCASCDAPFFKGRPVAVVGDESEAAESAALLAEIASKVYWISKGVKASSNLVEKAKKRGVVSITDWPTKIIGDKTVSGIEVGSGTKYEVNGVFITLGAKGSLELALELGLMPDPSGLVPVDANCKTEMDGVFACGDVTGTPWQLAKAVGQGCVAGENVGKWLREKKA